MSDLLFDVPEQLSPRMAWMMKNDVQTYLTPHLDVEEEPWNCWSGDLQRAMDRDRVEHGKTEDEAITEWAKANHQNLWNEE